MMELILLGYVDARAVEHEGYWSRALVGEAGSAQAESGRHGQSAGAQHGRARCASALSVLPRGVLKEGLI